MELREPRKWWFHQPFRKRFWHILTLITETDRTSQKLGYNTYKCRWPEIQIEGVLLFTCQWAKLWEDIVDHPMAPWVGLPCQEEIPAVSFSSLDSRPEKILERALTQWLQRIREDVRECTWDVVSALCFWMVLFFPTCQVRVVRFYQSALPPRPRPPPRPPPPRPLPPRPPPRLLLQFLLDHVCINFHLHLRLANSSPSSLPALFADSLRQALCQLPSSVCTAGPQPGTCPAQCAPLHLNGQIECQKICQMECQIECKKIYAR